MRKLEEISYSYGGDFYIIKIPLNKLRARLIEHIGEFFHGIEVTYELAKHISDNAIIVRNNFSGISYSALKSYSESFKQLEVKEVELNPRKSYPMYRGLFKYFPNALMEVSKVSLVANKQHNEGDEIYWNREKSTDNEDAMLRHMVDFAKGSSVDEDGLMSLAKVAWRALASLEIELEKKA